MQRQEALTLLNASEEDYLPDLFEEKLFEIKQYLISKPVVSKLWMAQVKKLRKLQEVSVVLGLDVEDRNSDFSGYNLKNTSNVLQCFLDLERCRTQFKLEIMKSVVPSEIISLINDFLNIQQEYLSLWPEFPNEDMDEVVIGKEPDPMDLIHDLKNAKGNGELSFSDLIKDPPNEFPTLMNEWKRVSLLRKKEQEWKTSLEN